MKMERSATQNSGWNKFIHIIIVIVIVNSDSSFLQFPKFNHSQMIRWCWEQCLCLFQTQWFWSHRPTFRPPRPPPQDRWSPNSDIPGESTNHIKVTAAESGKSPESNNRTNKSHLNVTQYLQSNYLLWKHLYIKINLMTTFELNKSLLTICLENVNKDLSGLNCPAHLLHNELLHISKGL